MSIPRFLNKSLVTEIPHTFQTSASNSTVLAGATLTHARDFNLQLAGFLNPFGLADPPSTEWIVAGHVLYVYARFAAGAATGGINVEVHANHGNGLAFRLVSANMLAASLTPGNGAVARFADAGAAWSLRVIFRNTGTSNATGLDYAIAVRAY